MAEQTAQEWAAQHDAQIAAQRAQQAQNDAAYNAAHPSGQPGSAVSNRATTIGNSVDAAATAAQMGNQSQQLGYTPAASAYQMGGVNTGGMGGNLSGPRGAFGGHQMSLQDYYTQLGQQGIGGGFGQNLNYLQNLAQGGGMSPAQMQLQQGLQGIQAGIQSQAAGVRGGNAGSNLRAMLNAQQGASGQYNDQQAMLRAQEIAQFQQQLGQQYGQQSQYQHGMNQLGLQAANAQTGFNAQREGQLMGNELSYDQMSNQRFLGGLNSATEIQLGKQQGQQQKDQFGRALALSVTGKAAEAGATAAMG